MKVLGTVYKASKLLRELLYNNNTYNKSHRQTNKVHNTKFILKVKVHSQHNLGIQVT